MEAFSSSDLVHEEELLRNPFGLRTWWHYLEHLDAAEEGGGRGNGPARAAEGDQREICRKKRRVVFERALRALPGSYKLWHAYLRERVKEVEGLPPGHASRQSVVNTFERSLVTMNKMPRVWVDYLTFLTRSPQKALKGSLTLTRRCFDRALRALPITQHDRVWPLYLDWARSKGVPTETGLRVYRRYLQLEPAHREEYVEYLKSRERWGEGARVLASCVQDSAFDSISGKTKHQLWLELCDLITTHPEVSNGLDVEAILQSGIAKFKNEIGRLWTSLADYYIRRGMFEVARDTYMDGITSVTTVRDFSLIYDAFAQYEESMISAKMEALAESSGGQAAEDGEDPSVSFLVSGGTDDLDLRLSRLEKLMEERAELLNAVILRQNPHNVHEWFKRAKIFNDKPAKQVAAFAEAVKTVDPKLAVGKYHTLWVGFARFYEDRGKLEDARSVFGEAISVEYRTPEDLSSVWCEWAEMEIRHKHYEQALELTKRATTPDSPCVKSLRVWMLRVDLTESLQPLEEVKAVYQKMLDLKIATPQIVLNFAALMQEHRYFEESFKVYERGVSLFRYPHSKDIWKAYLAKFVERYKGQKVERTRELFEHALSHTPVEESPFIYLQFASFEEAHGLAKNVMAIFERAVKAVPADEKLKLCEVYLSKASEFYGVAKVRSIYQQALEDEPPSGMQDKDVRVICAKFANMEKKLGEIDRARAIFRHGSQLADPKQARTYWEEWNAFEVAHGNEDTFREMLRIKRSVNAFYGQTTTIPTTAPQQQKGPGTVDSMAQLEAEAQAAAAPASLPGFVKAETMNIGEMKSAEKEENDANPEDIDIDVDVDEDADADADTDANGGAEGDNGLGFKLKQKDVPAEVFGSLQNKHSRSEEKPSMGAMERFKRAKTNQ